MATENWTFTQSATDESWTFSDGVGPRGADGAAGSDGSDGADGSDASVTNANVNTAIADGPAATRTAAGVASELELDSSFLLLLDPMTRAYVSRARLTNRAAIQRIDQFIKGLDSLGIKDNLHAAVFLGAGQNTGDSTPIEFVSLDAATNVTTATFTHETHGCRIPASGGNLFDFAIGTVTDFTAIYMGSGMHTYTAYSRVMSLGVYPDAIQLSTNDTSGFLKVRAFKTGHFDHNSSGWAPNYATDTPTLAAVQWDSGTGYKRSVDGAAWDTVTAYTHNLAADTDTLQVGQHAGIVQGGIVFDTLLDDAEIAAVNTLARRTVFTSNIRLVGEGNSIIELNSPDNPYWPRLALRSGDWGGASFDYTNLATGGHTAKNVYDQAVAGSMNAFKPTVSNPSSWLILQCLNNDFARADAGDYTNTQILFHTTETARIAKEAGFEKVIVCTSMPKAIGTTEAREADAVTVNEALRNGTAAGIEHVDIVLDIDAAMIAEAGADYHLDASLFVSGPHPTLAGKQVMADALNAAAGPLRSVE